MVKNIGFIGTGVMGASIVKHLLKAGFNVSIYTRTKEKALPLIALGAQWGSTVGEAVEKSDLIFTMVGMPSDVREVYFGQQGILNSAKKGAVLVDMTTSEPSLAKELYEAAKANGLHSLDAPVSGGDIGAQNGTLSIMVGGDEGIFTQVQSVLAHFGTQIVYQGDAGSGQHAKMCNQIVVANNLIGVCESITYAVKSGLDAEKVLSSISSGAAGSWSLSNLGPKILQSDFAPGFYIKHMLKDLIIALQEAKAMNIELPGLQKATEMFEVLQERGFGDEGTQALITYYLNNDLNRSEQ